VPLKAAQHHAPTDRRLALLAPAAERGVKRAFMFEVKVESMFHIAGHGTVLAGHVRSGRVSLGDKVEIRSPTKSARSVIAGLEAHRSLLHHADAGTDVGVLLRNFVPDSVSDGLELDESNAWRVVSLVLHGVSRPWWKLW